MREVRNVREIFGLQGTASCLYRTNSNRNEAYQHSEEIKVLYEKLRKLELISSTLASIAHASVKRKSNLHEDSPHIRYSILESFSHTNNSLTHGQ